MMTNHEMITLNTTYVNKDTPKRIKDWMDLIIESMNNPENPQINFSNPNIVKAVKLAAIDRLTPEQLAEAKEMEMRKATIALVEDTSRNQERDKGILKALKRGKLTKEEIAEDFEVAVSYVEQLEKD